ncbi:hypothetical protein [Crenobacter cavernae]|uniref:SMODS-associating 2TM beta-strand rich effector domain-containing protein n=1 Tax=Crenobacter cavernae TaxID=2290923 RepID=A0A345Y8E0_9NEIS|nr:hypothetical protein [Crenobacter cavernae]AXK40192.1 hypothetical protein DWG20_12480 [Crenobacter cavernae]
MEHEYSVLGGLNRAAIGRYLSIMSALVASTLGATILSIVDFARRLGWADPLPPLILWPLTGGLIYMVLYWLFDTRIWRWKKIAELLKVPDLSGTWRVAGQTINQDKTLGNIWEGEITIVQSWDKLRVRLKTKQSASNSIAAALVYDKADGFRLIYNYKNEPKIGERELMAHRGSAELVFDDNLQTATGEYFNGHGRYTFGTMKLSREK